MPPQDNASVGSRSSVFASNPASPPPATSSHVRSSTTDDRLAELHAKFGLSRSSTQLSASGASGTATPGLGMESNSGAESGASSVPNPTAGPGTSASDALRQKLAAMKNVGAASNGSSSTLTSAPAPEENVEA